jgi:hypothetical protein
LQAEEWLNHQPEMSFPTTPIITNFTGANEDPLSEGGTWGGPTQNGRGLLQRLNNVAKASASVSTSYAQYYNPAIYGPDCESYTTIAVLPVNGVVVHARIQNPGNATTMELYAGVYSPGIGWRIFRCLNGSSFTQVGSTTASPAAQVGVGIGLEVIGTTLTLKHYTGGQWNDRVTGADSSIAEAGFIGLQVDDTTASIDDFGGGTIDTGSAYRTHMGWPRRRVI